MYDPTILPVTLVLLILIGITVVMNFYKMIPIMISVYVLYILFTLFSGPETKHNQISKQSIPPETVVEEQPEVLEPAPVEVETIPEKIIEDELISEPLRLNQIYICEDIDVANRETINASRVFQDTIQYLYCFTGIDNRNGSRHNVRHVWTYNSSELTTVNMDIERSVHWRCWSRVKILPSWIGKWDVSVRDSNDVEFGSINFEVVLSDSI